MDLTSLSREASGMSSERVDPVGVGDEVQERPAVWPAFVAVAIVLIIAAQIGRAIFLTVVHVAQRGEPVCLLITRSALIPKDFGPITSPGISLG